MVVGVNWLTLCQECRSPQGSILDPLVFLLYTLEHFSILENKLIGNANDSSLMAIVPSSGVRVTVEESLIHYLGRVSKWCDLWGMKLNACKTKTMIVSWLRTMHPQSPLFNYWQNCTEGVWWSCYIGSDIWIQNDLWEASSLGFWSNFSKTWYLEEVLPSIPW